MRTKNIIIYFLLHCCFVACYKEPIACFEYESKSTDDGFESKVSERVTFNNCSIDATKYYWDFGDDETSSMMNPSHKYEKAGIYSVKLEAEGNGGSQFSQQDIMIISLDGDWEGTFKIGNSVFLFYFDLEQDGSELNGFFELSDGSTSSIIKSSKIDETDVLIQFIVDFTEDTYTFKFTGEVNSAYNHMEGELLINREEYGTWSANKFTSKSVSVSQFNEQINGFQKLEKLLIANK